jgi:hypothetical protein
MKSTIRPALLLAAGLLVLAPGRGQALDGEMVYVYGEVRVHRNDVAHSAEAGMPVGLGDVIATGPDAMAIIGLDGGAELKLRQNTSLALDSLGEEINVTLSRGGVFSRVTKRLRGRYEVRTLTAVAGVRGTEFFVEYGRTIDLHPDIGLCVNSGSVEVEVIDSGETVLVDAGKGINIIGGTRLTKPRFYPWTRKLNWNVDPARGEVIDTTDLDQAYGDLLDQDYD